MAVREIMTLPNPVLRRKTRKVTDFGPELQTLIDDMVETMREAPGVGLAAPQVNDSQQLIVVEFGDEEDENVPPKLYILTNPEISRLSKETTLGVEGCLSIPGIVGEVERAEAAVVKGFNRRGQPVKIKAKGWLARIFQHEIDHLNGVLFVDKATRLWEQKDEPEEKGVAIAD
ncbi:MAG TPA: peptide deformylase [Anaerolineales bacterium]|jgi:peptide deformylase|nr:peptide deformylase [Anaerolineales bacterium]